MIDDAFERHISWRHIPPPLHWRHIATTYSLTKLQVLSRCPSKNAVRRTALWWKIGTGIVLCGSGTRGMSRCIYLLGVFLSMRASVRSSRHFICGKLAFFLPPCFSRDFPSMSPFDKVMLWLHFRDNTFCYTSNFVAPLLP
jgi:hypothetical protein